MPTNSFSNDVEQMMRRQIEEISQRQMENMRRSTNTINHPIQGDFGSGNWTNIASAEYYYDPSLAQQRPLAQPRRPGRSISEMLGREPSQLMQRRKKEKEEVERLIETGISDQTKYVDDNGTLFVFGYDMGETSMLFTADSEAITAHVKRSKHLKPLLTDLAKREGLELRFIDTPTDLPGSAREVVYYAFKNRGEVDDTELVAVTKPRFRGIQEEEPHDGGCGDPECVGCYGEEEGDEEEPLWD